MFDIKHWHISLKEELGIQNNIKIFGKISKKSDRTDKLNEGKSPQRSFFRNHQSRLLFPQKSGNVKVCNHKLYHDLKHAMPEHMTTVRTCM